MTTIAQPTPSRGMPIIQRTAKLVPQDLDLSTIERQYDRWSYHPAHMIAYHCYLRYVLPQAETLGWPKAWKTDLLHDLDYLKRREDEGHITHDRYLWFIRETGTDLAPMHPDHGASITYHLGMHAGNVDGSYGRGSRAYWFSWSEGIHFLPNERIIPWLIAHALPMDSELRAMYGYTKWQNIRAVLGMKTSSSYMAGL